MTSDSKWEEVLNLPYNRNVSRAEDIILDNLYCELDVLKLQQIADFEGFTLSDREAVSALKRSGTWEGYVQRKIRNSEAYILVKSKTGGK